MTSERDEVGEVCAPCLWVNVDHVATLRNARGTVYPDPVEAALLCLQAGAVGITAHLREDRRHIVDEDVDRLRKAVPLFNLEIAPTEAMCDIALRVQPDRVTLVPERREERTTEGGLNLSEQYEQLAPVVDRLLIGGLQVSPFLEPDILQIVAAKNMGVQQIELHTGRYAHAAVTGSVGEELARLGQASNYGHSVGLRVAAGHGLCRGNVAQLVCKVSWLCELNIGHAVVADALFVSLAKAVALFQEEMVLGHKEALHS